MDIQKTTTSPQPVYSPAPVPVEEFVDGIRRLSEGIITKQAIYEYLVSFAIRAEGEMRATEGSDVGGENL